ncbi:MAG: hypothetical protein JWO06_2277 [Bacteroidota bacterium]|nr:hypothetical protein [Bacteroidota bacterium]
MGIEPNSPLSCFRKSRNGIWLLLLLPLFSLSQSAKQGPLSTKQKLDLLWTHTRQYDNPARYTMIDKYFTITGVVSFVGRGIDNNDCDSTFNVKLSNESKKLVDSLTKADLKLDKSADIHIEISCATSGNCKQPQECDGFKYPFLLPQVPALFSKVSITGCLVIEKHGKYQLEMHPVSEIKILP